MAAKKNNPRLVQIDARLEADSHQFGILLLDWQGAYEDAILESTLRKAQALARGRDTVEKESPAGLKRRLRAMLQKSGRRHAVAALKANGGSEKFRDRDVSSIDGWEDFISAMEESAVNRTQKQMLRLAEQSLKQTAVSPRAFIKAALEQKDKETAKTLIWSRNLLATAEALGTEQAYDDQGIDAIEWLAFTSPTFARMHHKLDNEIAARDEGFRMPKSGAKLRYPHDPRGPIGETINCRCSKAPVLPGTAAWERWQDSRAKGKKSTKADTPVIRDSKTDQTWQLDAEAAEQGYDLVRMEAADLRRALQDLDANRIKDTPAEETRQERARKFMLSSSGGRARIDAPRLDLTEKGQVKIASGRHILEAAVAQAEQAGAKTIPVAVQGAAAKAVVRKRVREAKTRRPFRRKIEDTNPGQFIVQGFKTDPGTPVPLGGVRVTEVLPEQIQPGAKRKLGGRRAFVIDFAASSIASDAARDYLIREAMREIEKRKGAAIAASDISDK